MVDLHKILSIRASQKHIVAVCGAGGKSSLIKCLAEEIVQTGMRVCIMTTTRFRRPEDIRYKVFDEFDPSGYESAWKNRKIVVVGEKGRVFGIRPPLPPVYAHIIREAEAIYIEADGSKQLPIKYPESWEPVLPAEAGNIVLVAGLSAIGKPIDAVCHRKELARTRLNITENIMTEKIFADILTAGYLRFNPAVLLNQADTQEISDSGELAAALLRLQGFCSVNVVSLKNMFGLRPDV